jgi:RimJ/RimL family protein N-acetyltransferase
MVPLITERLLLRALRESDLECVFAILNDETTTAGVSWRQRTREDAGAWLARRIESQRSLGVSVWGVEDRSSAEVVGLCGFFPHESQLRTASPNDSEFAFAVRKAAFARYAELAGGWCETE